jgi:hypothetical protein
LEHAERVLGSGGFEYESSTGGRGEQIGGKGKIITAETMPSPSVRPMSIVPSEHGQGGFDDGFDEGFDATPSMVSRYAAQPEDVREGIHTAYKSLSKNINAAAQTILAVPMEVYEQSGSGVSTFLSYSAHPFFTSHRSMSLLIDFWFVFRDLYVL